MKPSIPRGTRDFGPAEMQKRNYIFSVVRKNFELFGYQSIETPAMENLSTLLGKYGEEGDKLIFKIQNSAAKINCNEDELNNLFEKFTSLDKGLPEEAYKGGDENSKIAGKKNLRILEQVDELIEKIKREFTEKGLRYDLTVPFARYVVMNQGKLTFPLKRYQMQPVWRADKPQKGRYREFYQCDADIIGSNSLINELELISLLDKSFSDLNVPVVLKLNNRKILSGIAELIGAPNKMIDIAIAIDKFEKIGEEGVKRELTEKGFNTNQISQIHDIILLHADKVAYSSNTINRVGGNLNLVKLNVLRNTIGNGLNSEFTKGLDELEYLFENHTANNIKIEFDITLARGLDYYTGTIFEVKANEGTFTPSILGGGRYDDLTGVFGLKNMSGVGISFGIDRIYDVMEELNLFPLNISTASSAKVMFLNFGEEEVKHSLKLASELRKQDISCEIYSDQTKQIGKQFEYAEKKNIPFVIYVKKEDINKAKYDLKDIREGLIENLNIEDIIKKLK